MITKSAAPTPSRTAPPRQPLHARVRRDRVHAAARLAGDFLIASRGAFFSA